MLSGSFAPLLSLTLLALSEPAFGRFHWPEHNGRALFPRRFSQQNPAFIGDLSSACPGQFCGVLAGKVPSSLLAAADECAQQDLADEIIDTAAQFDAATQQTMIDLAIKVRTAEKNTPPDFSVQPNVLRNSVFCQRAPKNSQLNGLVQAQDPANDPNVFFDPATKASVKKGDQPNTFPFGTSGSSSSSNSTSTATAAVSSASATSVTATVSITATATTTGAVLIATDTCPTAVTITVTAAESAATAAASTTASAATATSTAALGDANFGSCTVPEIEFGAGFDGRKETSFQPVDKTSYDHGSAQAIGIIAQFECDQLTNKCGANQAAKTLCAQAQTAVNGAAAKTGGQADLFNAVFGKTTNFAAVAAIDDQGKVIAGTGSGSAVASSAAATVTSPATAAASAAASTTTAAAAAASASSSASTGSADFGSCTPPEIEFGAGFDGRKETSFQPVDKASFNHGSAQAIGIIAQFECDQLTNTCGANQAAKDLCAQAQTAVNGAAAKTGGQADLFNAVFGKTTNFAAVAAIDNQGNVIAGTGSASAASSASASAAATNVAAAPTASSTTAASSGAADFGSCSAPQIEFGAGFDGRKETSFQPVDKTSYDHGSAQAIGIIAQFECDQLTNKCGANQAAKTLCAQAQTAVNGATAKTGGQADLFNAVFGKKTNFAAVTALDDQGKPLTA